MARNKAAAILTVHNAADMTEEGRKAVVKWLRKQAKFLMDYPNELSPRFTARYLYSEKE